MKKYSYVVTRRIKNLTTGEEETRIEKTNSKRRAEQMKKDYICLGNKIKVLEYHIS